jgi:hypothetical protein
MSNQYIIKQTKNWLENFIITFNICPFAHKAYKSKSIHYSIVKSNNLEECLATVLSECQRLDTEFDIETTLIIYPNHFSDFNDFNDFIYLSEQLLVEYDFEGIYQLAHFHPLYCFEGEHSSDPANYTNRSPYPMLHLISESNLERDLLSFSQPENIPTRNIKLLRKMGLTKIKTILKYI